MSQNQISTKCYNNIKDDIILRKDTSGDLLTLIQMKCVIVGTHGKDGEGGLVGVCTEF